MTIVKANQTINFEPIAASELKPNNTVKLVATSSSGLPVRFTSSNNNIAEVIDGVLHIKAVGSCTIRAIQDGDDRYNSASTAQKIDVTTSLKSTNEQKISIYPNPASSFVTIEGVNNSHIEIYSLTGNLLIQSTEKTINIEHLPAGIYLVKIGNINQRLIKL